MGPIFAKLPRPHWGYFTVKRSRQSYFCLVGGKIYGPHLWMCRGKKHSHKKGYRIFDCLCFCFDHSKSYTHTDQCKTDNLFWMALCISLMGLTDPWMMHIFWGQVSQVCFHVTGLHCKKWILIQGASYYLFQRRNKISPWDNTKSALYQQVTISHQTYLNQLFMSHLLLQN